MTGTVAIPEFRPVQRTANKQAVKKLRELLRDAEDGKITGLAWVVDYGGDVGHGHTASDNSLHMLAASARLTHQLNLTLDEEYGI